MPGARRQLYDRLATYLGMRGSMVHEVEQLRGYESAAPQRMVLAEVGVPELQAMAEQEALQFMGGVAIRGLSGEVQAQEAMNESSLMGAAQLAALGDEASRKLVQASAATDFAERLFKAGHQTRVALEMVGGRLMQNDRSMTDIHKNTLEHTTLNAEMLRRAKYELRNILLFQRLHRLGVFEAYHAVVFSPASTTMNNQQKHDYGFYTDTESCSIQMISAEGDQVVLETALVAGKATADGERHDIAAIQRLAAGQGVAIPTTDGTEMIRHVLLIPKTQATGVEDVVALYDQAAGNTFYGEAKPQEDYHAYAIECIARADSFGDMVESLTTQLISESHTFRTPLDAIRRLDKLSQELCVQRAVSDETIDEAIFGKVSAVHIQDTRFFIRIGQYERAKESFAKAKATAASSSCPMFKGEEKQSGDGPDGKNDEEEPSEKKWMHCPYCEADVYDDPCAKRLFCKDCTALVVNGKVLSTGNGGRKRRQAAGQAVVETFMKQLVALPQIAEPAPTPVVPPRTLVGAT